MKKLIGLLVIVSLFSLGSLALQKDKGGDQGRVGGGQARGAGGGIGKSKRFG